MLQIMSQHSQNNYQLLHIFRLSMIFLCVSLQGVSSKIGDQFQCKALLFLEEADLFCKETLLSVTYSSFRIIIYFLKQYLNQGNLCTFAQNQSKSCAIIILNILRILKYFNYYLPESGHFSVGYAYQRFGHCLMQILRQSSIEIVVQKHRQLISDSCFIQQFLQFLKCLVLQQRMIQTDFEQRYTDRLSLNIVLKSIQLFQKMSKSQKAKSLCKEKTKRSASSKNSNALHQNQSSNDHKIFSNQLDLQDFAIQKQAQLFGPTFQLKCLSSLLYGTVTNGKSGNKFDFPISFINEIVATIKNMAIPGISQLENDYEIMEYTPNQIQEMAQPFFSESGEADCSADIEGCFLELTPYKETHKKIIDSLKMCSNQQLFWEGQDITQSMPVEQSLKVQMVFEFKKNLYTEKGQKKGHEETENSSVSEKIKNETEKAKQEEKKEEILSVQNKKTKKTKQERKIQKQQSNADNCLQGIQGNQQRQRVRGILKTKFLSYISQMLKNIFCVRLMNLEKTLCTFKKSHITNQFFPKKIQKTQIDLDVPPHIVMFLIIKGECQKQKFKTDFQPVKKIVKFWLSRLSASLNVVCFNPTMDTFQKSGQMEKRVKNIDDKVDQLSQFLKDGTERAEQILGEHQQIKAEHQQIQAEHQQIKAEHQQIKAEHQQIKDQFSKLREEFQALKSLVQNLQHQKKE